ncbi:hypothetical protein [Geomonas anaerohicana]|uniref:Uncharacterized protein n=1 Tax=Geomonas anaerohicana TaxID=2798583 RepID=A0ABS0YFS2_9BACT|nr:hypothetical protein [Geomonas anaerohicana]MBJ6751167.1 hypothetical protein [Geomonas anaerohicana]
MSGPLPWVEVLAVDDILLVALDAELAQFLNAGYLAVSESGRVRQTKGAAITATAENTKVQSEIHIKHHCAPDKDLDELMLPDAITYAESKQHL